MQIKKKLAVLIIMDFVMVILLSFSGDKKIQMVSGMDVVKEQQDYKKIALTFDDGSHPIYTEKLLDGLKEREVVATFFCNRGTCPVISRNIRTCQ